MFVKVTENAENVDEAVEIPVEPEGHILMSTLIAQFPGACGLKFKTEQSAWRGVRVVDEKLLPAGDDAWSEGLVYVVTFPKGKSSITIYFTSVNEYILCYCAPQTNGVF